MFKKKLIKKRLNNSNTLNRFRTIIYSRHPTHSLLRTRLELLPFRSLIRLGSTTMTPNDGKRRIELNSIQGVRNSSNKLLMKQCFTSVGCKTANWWVFSPNRGFVEQFQDNHGIHNVTANNQLPYPIIAKSLTGSRGIGNTKLDNQVELEQWIVGKILSNYIFEKFYTYSKEYRLHVTKNGCFYTCRKLIRNDAPVDTWQRHDDVCTWIVEENPKFMKPGTWNLIVQDCIKALNSLQLDIAAFDVLVQGSSKVNPEWIICESCSAPSHGLITTEKYLLEIPKLLKIKYNNG